MKQPILSIKVLCKECKDGILDEFDEEEQTWGCKCKGTGQQTKSYYPLTEEYFERCKCWCHQKKIQLKCGCEDNFGFKILFKDYEIKTIKDFSIGFMDKNDIWELMEEHNLKESDKIVITRE